MTNAEERRPRAFVLMPFQTEFHRIYTDLILPALTEVGYEVRRADSILDQRNILADIVRGIVEADLVIAELTILNANVLYELGIAHGLMKPTIMLTQDIGQLPFDLRSYRVVIYSVRYDEVGSLQTALRDVAQSHHRGEVEFGNPVKDFAPELLAIRTKPTVEEGSLEITGEEPEESSGLLGFVHAALASLERISQHTNRVNAYTAALTGAIQARAAELQVANALGGPGAAAQQQRIVVSVGSHVSDFLRKLDADILHYESARNTFADSSAGIVGMARIDDPDYRRVAMEFRDTLAELRTGIEADLEGMQGFRTSISQLRDLRLNRDLNQSLREADLALTNAIELFTTQDSYLSRIVNILDERLDRGEPRDTLSQSG